MDRTYARNGSKWASAINIIAGLWLFVSPWVYRAYASPDAWNSWIVGAIIAIFAIIQYNNPAGNKFLSWINCFLGIWVFFSSWIYAYTGNTGPFVNSLCVGVIVFVLGVRAATTSPLQSAP
jgi:uncharacterized membrane protein